MVPPVPITATLGREDVMSLPSVWIENSEGVAQSFQFAGLWKLDAMFLQLTICSASGRPLEEQPAKHVLRAELQTAPKGVGAACSDNISTGYWFAFRNFKRAKATVKMLKERLSTAFNLST